MSVFQTNKEGWNPCGYSAFNLSTLYGHQDIFEYFLDQKLNGEMNKDPWYSPLVTAVYGGQETFVKYLLSRVTEITPTNLTRSN